ncbi:hypothetical protein HC766_01405 [Candidatus Gracilibacteria bacterium]|nr:hypothetical protein [Candidatus Gracilibacteria bacterium]
MLTTILTLLVYQGLAIAKPASAEPEYQEPQYHITIDQVKATMTINDGYSSRIERVGVAKAIGLRIPKGDYTIDKQRINDGVTHFSGWGNSNLMAWYSMPIVPIKDGKPTNWIGRQMVPVIHTQPDNCYGLQSYISQKKDLKKICPPPITLASKGLVSNGCIRLDADDAKSLYSYVFEMAKSGKYLKILIK